MQLFSKTFRFFESLFLNSWWVILFALGCYTLFERGLQTQKIEYNKLQMQRIDLENQKQNGLFLQQRLLLEINSLSDPAFLEIVLMRGLGLMKNEQVKIYFDKSIETKP